MEVVTLEMQDDSRPRPLHSMRLVAGTMHRAIAEPEKLIFHCWHGHYVLGRGGAVESYRETLLYGRELSVPCGWRCVEWREGARLTAIALVVALQSLPGMDRHLIAPIASRVAQSWSDARWHALLVKVL